MGDIYQTALFSMKVYSHAGRSYFIIVGADVLIEIYEKEKDAKVGLKQGPLSTILSAYQCGNTPVVLRGSSYNHA